MTTVTNKHADTKSRTHIKRGLPPVSGCGASVVMRDLYSDTALPVIVLGLTYTEPNTAGALLRVELGRGQALDLALELFGAAREHIELTEPGFPE
jgi:hypothetical protein